MRDSTNNELLHIGHPGGIIDIGTVIEMEAEQRRYRDAATGRTYGPPFNGRLCFGSRSISTTGDPLNSKPTRNP
jgi:hypothetical protein